jgi:hypothetical protein
MWIQWIVATRYYLQMKEGVLHHGLSNANKVLVRISVHHNY